MMMISRLEVAVVLVGLGLLSCGTEAVRFELESGRTKCMSEDINSNSLTVGKYDVVNPHHDDAQPFPDSHKLTVRVTSRYGNTYHYVDHVSSGQFAFTAAEAGDYTACFWAATHQPPVNLTVDFNWRTGVAAKDWSNVAKRGSVEVKNLVEMIKLSKSGEVMELELRKLYDGVISIQEEMYYLRQREEEMQELNRATNSRMGWLSFLSLLVALSVAGLQVWHLKTFFEKKKII